MMSIRITYDEVSDAAYIYLREIESNEKVRMYSCDPIDAGMINLDFDSLGCLVGIEVISASTKLPATLLPGFEGS
jgi:uncharacterized protein YuzE